MNDFILLKYIFFKTKEGFCYLNNINKQLPTPKQESVEYTQAYVCMYNIYIFFPSSYQEIFIFIF